MPAPPFLLSIISASAVPQLLFVALLSVQTLGVTGVFRPMFHIHSIGVCASSPFKGLLRNLASAPPYSIPGSICCLLAAFQGSEANSERRGRGSSILSRQSTDWQNKRQQLQFITLFIIQDPA